MNYQNHYDKLIERARNRLLEGYTEKHHIIPKCMNGSNDITNIIDLTPEEHYVAHQLLVKIYPENRKLIYAAKMMAVNSSNQFRNNKLYGWLRKKYSEIKSESQKGENNPFYGKFHTEESKKLMGPPRGNVPWNAGLKTGPRSEESKQKQSNTTKGRKQSKEHILKRTAGAKGRKFGPHSEESNQRRSVAMKKYWTQKGQR